MAETGRNEIVWRPTREYAERTRLARFMRSLGVGSLEELQRRSVAEPDWYWDAVVRDVGLRFSRPYTRVRDVSRGVQWPSWFEGGLMNFTDNCVDRHIDAGRGEQPAVVWEGDDGRTRTLSYRELASEVNQLANALKRLGVGEGDRVGVFLPMSPEAAIATLAIVRIGAIYTPCF
jgi:acetyl-CoA synthetase